MSWLPVIAGDDVGAEAQQMFAQIRERWGFVPNYFQALGHDPQLLSDQMNLFTNALHEDRGLPRIIKEELALVVSGLNTSSYCLAAHMQILGNLGIEKAVSRKLAVDFQNASVEPNVMELFRFAEKLTLRPADMEKADVDRLRDAGWSEPAIFDTVLIASLYNCANRFSAALGLIADF